MTDADREEVLRAVRNNLKKPAPIVITHGTDTLVQTGMFLQRNLPHLTVPITLTGAMTPLGFERSGGPQDLTEAFWRAHRSGRSLPRGAQPGFSHRRSSKRQATGPLRAETGLRSVEEPIPDSMERGIQSALRAMEDECG